MEKRQEDDAYLLSREYDDDYDDQVRVWVLLRCDWLVVFGVAAAGTAVIGGRFSVAPPLPLLFAVLVARFRFRLCVICIDR